MASRSVTGCYTCKRRRKKCDETQPKCMRCAKAGLECDGYPPLESPDDKGVMRRAGVGPVQSYSSSNWPRSTLGISCLRSADQSHTQQPVASTFQVGGALLPNRGSPSDTESCAGTPQPHQSVDFPLFSPPNSSQLVDSSVEQLSSTYIDPVSTPSLDLSTQPSSYPPRSLAAPRASKGNSFPDQRLVNSENPRSMSPPPFLTTGQASLYEALFSLSRPENDLAPPSLPHRVGLLPVIVHGPMRSPSNLDTEPPNVEESSMKGAKVIMCKAITPDPNTPTNALPYVLQCYARWINFTVFEPSKLLGLTRNQTIGQFSSSRTSRRRIILAANVIGSLEKSPELNTQGLSILALLRTEARHIIKQFQLTNSTECHNFDRDRASKALHSLTEAFMFQRFSYPLSSVLRLMQEAAPVFRRACPEPPTQLVNLPNILVHPDHNLRHFVAVDVVSSASTGRPMLFRYDVSYTAEIADRLVEGDLGFQWLHGAPDQFIILFALISGLYEDFGTQIDPRVILDIQNQIENVPISPRPAGNPLTGIWRAMVQECWRQSVYVYLYMCLCGAPADDPRVLKAVRCFTALLDMVKPGRNPDYFLLFPLIIAGAAAYRAQDQDILRSRMLGLRECTEPCTIDHDALLTILDIWERTEAERRPAVWGDLRIATFNITGM